MNLEAHIAEWACLLNLNNLAKKSVAVIQPDGTRSHHTTFIEAYAAVNQETAAWDGIAQGFDSQFKAIRLHDKRVMSKDKLAWKARFSGDRGSGLTKRDKVTGEVREVLIREYRAPVGTLVLQAS